jgi:hypothetical protein
VFYVGVGTDRRGWSLKRSDFWKNIAKKNGVTIEVYKDGLSRNDAFAIEVDLIRTYKEVGERICNLSSGGEKGGVGVVHSEDVRVRMSRGCGGRPVYCSNGMIFETYQQAARWLGGSVKCASHKISKCCRGMQNTAYGYAWAHNETPEVPIATGNAAKGMVSHRRPVLCSNGMYFSSIQEAAMWANPINPESARVGISCCCSGKKKTAIGFSWSYAEDK